MRLRLSRQQFPLAATALVCIALYTVACLSFDGFFSARVFVNFFSDNAFLGIAAIGMTFVILSGGIDLSVGALVGCSSILIARLIHDAGLHPIAAFLLVLVAGTVFGATMGALIHYFGQPAFLVTLAGMFLARGLGFVIRIESIPIRHSFYDSVSRFRIPLGGGVFVPATALLFLLVFALGVYLYRSTRFGRNTIAIGGNETSALLMGLPVGRTKVGIYALSGFCASLAGIVYTLYTYSGNPTAGTMLELDAIAAVVIGGTLLTGGVGTVLGTLLGVLVFGIIQTAIVFEGTLSSWWTRITIGLLLMAFILLQRFFQRKG